MNENLPKFDDLMLPILKMFEDGNIHTRTEVRERVFKKFTPEQLSVQIPSGKRGLIANRISWALQYLRFANALETTSRGEYRITNNGKKLLSDKTDKITVKDLKQFPEFDDSTNKPKKETETMVVDATPDDAIRNIIEENNKRLKKEILNSIMNKDPYFFESLVLDLLGRMGYGKTEGTPKAHDNGFDGVIYQDRLGVDRVYTQAKRYKEDNLVQQPEIDKFIGILHQNVTRSSKGIFITTSDFIKSARERAKADSMINIVLINGDELVKLMIEYGVGVNTKETYALKEIDEEYLNKN